MVTNCDHLNQLKFSKALPFAFTEYGAVALANVLASPQAVEMGIYVVRAFVRLRELAATHSDLAKRPDEIQAQTDHLALKHDAFANITRKQLKEVFEALRQLTMPPDPPKRPIGFGIPDAPTRPKVRAAKRKPKRAPKSSSPPAK